MTNAAARIPDSSSPYRDSAQDLGRVLTSALDEASRTVNNRAEVRTGKLAAEATEHLLACALELVPWVGSASITHRAAANRAPTTFGSTSEDASAVDELQFHAGQGPCLDVMGSAEAGAPRTAMTGDLSVDLRWPLLAAELRAAGTCVATMVSLPLVLPAGEYGALNLYGRRSDSTSEHERMQSARLAGAVVGVGFTALLHRRKADNLLEALESSRQIGAALGILMMHHRWSYDRAFTTMRTHSQLLHRKIRDIAGDVLFTGDLPPLPASVRDDAQRRATG